MNPLVGVTRRPPTRRGTSSTRRSPTRRPTDFATIPGLAESWKGSDDGKTWTYTMRAGPQVVRRPAAHRRGRRLHDQPRREEEWLNYTSAVANLTAKADRRPHARRHVVGARSEAADDGRLHPAQAHLVEAWTPRRSRSTTPLDGVGSGPFVLEQLEKGQFCALQGQPELLGRRAARSTRSSSASSTTPTRWSRRSRTARSTRPMTSRQRVRSSSRRTDEHRDRPGLAGRLQRDRDQRRRRASRRRHPALPDIEVRRAIAHAIDKQTLVDRVLAGLGKPADTLSPSPDPDVAAGDPGRRALRLRPRRGERDPRRGRLQGHDGDGVREMPGGGERCTSATPSARSAHAPADRRVRHAAGCERSASAPAARSTTTAGSPRSSARATTTCSSGAGRRSSTPTRCSRTSRAPRSARSRGPDELLQRRQLVRRSTTRLYKEQNGRARPGQARRPRAPDADQIMYDAAAYNVLYYDPDLQAYRTDRFTGWLRQPAETGPVHLLEHVADATRG